MQVRSVEDIGGVIRDARLRHGLTQEDLAKDAGVTARWLRAIERGKPGAEIGLILRVISRLGIEINMSDPVRRPATTNFREDEFPDIDEILGGLTP